MIVGPTAVNRPPYVGELQFNASEGRLGAMDQQMRRAKQILFEQLLGKRLVFNAAFCMSLNRRVRVVQTKMHRNLFEVPRNRWVLMIFFLPKKVLFRTFERM